MTLRLTHDRANTGGVYVTNFKLAHDAFAFFSSEVIHKPLGRVFRRAISKWIEDHPHSTLRNFWSAVGK